MGVRKRTRRGRGNESGPTDLPEPSSFGPCFKDSHHHKFRAAKRSSKYRTLGKQDSFSVFSFPTPGIEFISLCGGPERTGGRAKGVMRKKKWRKRRRRRRLFWRFDAVSLMEKSKKFCPPPRPFVSEEKESGREEGGGKKRENGTSRLSRSSSS